MYYSPLLHVLILFWLATAIQRKAICTSEPMVQLERGSIDHGRRLTRKLSAFLGERCSVSPILVATATQITANSEHPPTVLLKTIEGYVLLNVEVASITSSFRENKNKPFV